MRIKHLIVSIGLIITSFSPFAQIISSTEAENATLTGTYEVKPNANASGGEFVKLDVNSTLTFTVSGITAGDYKLNVFSFNGGATQDITLDVNGSSNSVTLQPSNWAFEGPAQFTSIAVNLTSGTNTIKFTRENVTVLMDYFTVTTTTPSNFNTYYISNTGDDNNDGLSEGSPWKTIEQANLALANDGGGGWIAPGDKVLFKRGDTFYGHLNINRSGTTDNLIELSSYGDENEELPIISGSGGTVTGGDYFQAITMANTSNVLLTKLWVKNNRTDGSRYTYGEYTSFGIKVIANKWGGISNNLTFKDLKISDVFGVSIPPPSDFNSLNATGIRFEGEENEPDLDIAIKDVLIEDCYFTHIGKAGVWAIHKGTIDDADDTVNRNLNFVIRNNHFFQTGGSGVILSKTNMALVENNNFDQTGYSDVSEPKLAGRGSGMWVWGCRNIVAQYNRSYGIRGPGDSYGMHMDFGNKNILFQYNYSEDSEGGFCEILGDNYNCTYRFNVSMNDGFRDFHGYTLWVSGYAGSGKDPIRSDKNYIYNNTIYLNSSVYTPRISIYALDTYVYNNIFVAINGAKIGYASPKGDGVSIDVGSGEFVMDNNLFEGDIHNDFKNYGANSQTGSPLFVNEGGTTKEDYKIQSGSPAIDAGKSFTEPSFPMAGKGIFKDISATALTDAFGLDINIQNALPNIGASNAYNSDNTLSVDAPIETPNLFKIYPNPVKDDIHLEFYREGESQEIFIYDIVGKVIFSTIIETTKKSSKISLPQNIKNGIYFLRLTEGNKSQTTQFILYR